MLDECLFAKAAIGLEANTVVFIFSLDHTKVIMRRKLYADRKVKQNRFTKSIVKRYLIILN